MRQNIDSSSGKQYVLSLKKWSPHATACPYAHSAVPSRVTMERCGGQLRQRYLQDKENLIVSDG